MREENLKKSMKKGFIFIFLFYIFILLLLLNLDIPAAENYEVIDRKLSGFINWTYKKFESEGFSYLDPDATNIAANELLTLKKAEENGIANLTTLITQMIVDSRTTILDFIKEDPEINRNIYEYVNKAYKSDIKYEKNRRSILFFLPFIMSDFSIYSALKLDRDYNNDIPIITAFPHETEFTSIVIDCRGYMILPALKPRIFSENRVSLITFDNIDYQTIKKNGYLTYICDTSGLKALKSLIGDNPFFISAIGSYGIHNTDIIISNEDIAFLLGNQSNLKLIKEGKIILLIDKNK
jgi:hypothetical protein